jgi:hypothetical protein
MSSVLIAFRKCKNVQTNLPPPACRRREGSAFRVGNRVILIALPPAILREQPNSEGCLLKSCISMRHPNTL